MACTLVNVMWECEGGLCILHNISSVAQTVFCGVESAHSVFRHYHVVCFPSTFLGAVSKGRGMAHIATVDRQGAAFGVNLAVISKCGVWVLHGARPGCEPTKQT